MPDLGADVPQEKQAKEDKHEHKHRSGIVAVHPVKTCAVLEVAAFILDLDSCF